MIDPKTLQPHEIGFSHLDERTNTFRIYAVTRIVEATQRPDFKFFSFGVVVTIDIDPKFARWMVKGRGLEEHRLARLRGFSSLDPVIFCKQDDGSHLLVDGSHRYVAAWLNKSTALRAYLLPISFWKPYLIAPPDNVTPEGIQRALTGWSGLT